MKILHVTTHWQAGGSERNILHHLDCLADAGHDVTLAVGSPVTDGLAMPSNVAIRAIPGLQRTPAPISDTRALLALILLIRRGRFDLVHTHLSKAGLLGRLAARIAGVPAWHTVHGPQMLTNPAFRLAERFAARFTDKTIFVGHDLRAAYQRDISDQHESAVIRSPIDVDRFRAIAEVNPQVARFNVLIAARLVAGKGLDRLVDLVTATHPGVHFTIAGDGPMLPDLEAASAQRGLRDRIDFLGYVRDLEHVIGDARLLINLSSFEGVPQVIIQAISAGRPVISVRANGVGEIFQDGETGHIVEPDDVESIARHLSGLFDDRRRLEEMATACRATDMSQWHPDSVRLRQLEILCGLS